MTRNSNQICTGLNATRSTVERRLLRFAVFALLAAILGTTAGCLPMLDRIAYVIRGTDVPAPYKGLSGKRTAIICVSEASAYGPDSLSRSVTRMVGATLLAKVKKIQLVPSLEVDKWIDENDWVNQDFVELGRGVKAERLVAIEISDYSIYEGQTLHKGRATVLITVYELDGEKGAVVGHTYQLPQYEFPKNGRPRTQMSDRQFEEFFLARLCRLLSNQFIPHDKFDSFADEAMLGL